MRKSIVICADGTWNRPEEDVESDVPTNVLRVARAIKPWKSNDHSQHVFYDWGVGSYYAKVTGGVAGRGIHKNIMDAYRYIVQNYDKDSRIYLFGFSRGAYTVRSLCGLINNCGILKRPDARLVEKAFVHYKNEKKEFSPNGDASIRFRKAYSHASCEVHFVGVWDTVGALGVPISLLGLLDRTDEFYDTKLGPNVRIARHAIAIDEQRADFEPTLWVPRDGLDMKQVWFSGVHSDIGGGYKPDNKGRFASDFPLEWMIAEAEAAGLSFEPHLKQSLNPSVRAPIHRSRRHIYRLRKQHLRPMYLPHLKVEIHQSVKERYQKSKRYRPKNLTAYLDAFGWPDKLGRQ